MEDREKFLWVRDGSTHHFHAHSVGQSLITWQYVTAQEAQKYHLCARRKQKQVLVNSWLISTTQIPTSNKR